MPLGAGAATFRSMGGTEGLSGPIVYDVEIASDRADVDAAGLLGQSVTGRFVRGSGTSRSVRIVSIFQNLKIPDILHQVFEGAGFGDFETAFARAYSARDCIVHSTAKPISTSSRD
jgi:uncharacterized protein involved in type VI secretion and phage assembly